MFCDRYLTGVVASDRANSAHGRLNVVPAYVLHHDDAFRTALAEHGGGPAGGLGPVEFQDIASADRGCLPAASAASDRHPSTGGKFGLLPRSIVTGRKLTKQATILASFINERKI